MASLPIQNGGHLHKKTIRFNYGLILFGTITPDYWLACTVSSTVSEVLMLLLISAS